MKRPEIPYLVAAVLLAAAACVLVALHDALPTFLPLAVIGLLSAGAGISLPGASLAPAAAEPAPAPAPAPLPAPVLTPAAAVPVVDTSATF